MPVQLPSLPPRGDLRPRPSASDLPPLRSARVLDQLRERCRLLHYSLRTEEVYAYWVKAFIRFHGLRHPAELGGPEVEPLSRGRVEALGLRDLRQQLGPGLAVKAQAGRALIVVDGRSR